MSKAATTLKPGTRAARAFAVERAAVNAEARTVELSFASEEPYTRWWGVEILDCTATAMRQGRIGNGRAPLLCDHDTRDQIGVVESVTLGADRIARALVRFGNSARAAEIFQDVVDGIRSNVSVGYLIHKAQLVETNSDDEDTYRVTDWEPYEVSLVSVPADATVGVGRSAEEDPRTPLIPPAPQENRAMTQATPTAPAAPEAPALNTSEIAAQARKAEQQRATELIALGDQFAQYGGKEIALRALEAGETLDQARAKVMNAIAAGQTKPVPHLDMSPKEVKRFSVLRAVRSIVDKDNRLAGLEREAHEAICQRLGIKDSPHGGLFIPADVQMARGIGAGAQQRDLTVGTPTAGGNMVATDLLGGSFIELLRARSVVARLGATMLPGLVGNVQIPKQTGAATAYWLANEATAITESQQTIGQVPLTPKTLGAYTEISRLLMLQSTPAADQMVMNDLARVLSLAIDLATLEGSGASGQPTGISATAGIGSVTGTSLAYAGIVEFTTDVAAGNALVPGCAFVTTPAVAGLLMQRQRFASTDTPLWTGTVLDGTLGGYGATTTTLVTAASMTFGDFSQVVIGEWGFLEIGLNPYANFTAAVTGIRAIQTVDVAIRQAAAFSRATSIT